jgi:hypothetical protein
MDCYSCPLYTSLQLCMAYVLQDAKGSDEFVEHSFAYNPMYNCIILFYDAMLKYCRTPRAATSMWSCLPASRSCSSGA